LLNECAGSGWCRKKLVQPSVQINEVAPDAWSIENGFADRSPNKQLYAAGSEKYRESQANPE